MRILLFLGLFWWLIGQSFGQDLQGRSFKMKDGPLKFAVSEIILWNDNYLGLSRSEKYVGIGKNPAQLEEIRIDSIFWQNIFLDEHKKTIIQHVIQPDWDNIYRKIIAVDIRDSVMLAHGFFAIDRIFADYKDPQLIPMTIFYDLRTRQSGLSIHSIQKQERLSAYSYIFYAKGISGKDVPFFHVDYQNEGDSSAFVISSTGPFVPRDKNLSYTRSVEIENRLVFAPMKWAINYKIRKDSTVDLYSNGYEIVDAKKEKVIFRSDSLYAISSPLFLYQGKICLLGQLLNHKTIMQGIEEIDRKIISISDNEYLPLPPGFVWRYHYVVAKGDAIPISNTLEALSYENEETKLVKVSF